MAAKLPMRQLRFVKEPELPLPLKPVVVFGLEGLVLCPSYLVYRFYEMLGDVELVMHQFGIRRLPSHRVGIGRKHVGGSGFHVAACLQDFDRKGFEEKGESRVISHRTAARSSLLHGQGIGTEEGGRPVPW